MKRLAALIVFLTGYAFGQAVTVTPIVQPHVSFVDNSGTPCAMCQLSSFAAGTSTPLATYTDSSGISQNTNPIILDISGSANIWVGTSTAYKFVLKDSLGSTLWTVDNVKGNAGGGLGTCTTNNAITYAVTSTSMLGCDSVILINPTSHAIEVGGPITGSAFTLRNLSTIPGSWTFDVTTPTTALNSLGLIPLSNLGIMEGASVVANPLNSNASPTQVALPVGCTTSINYDSSTGTFQCVSASSIPLSSLAAQSPDTVVMNATGSTIPPIAVSMPSGCTNGINYNTGSHSWSCITSSAGSTVNCLSASCAGGSTYNAFTSYTNNLSVPVTEMVTASLLGSSGTGGQYLVTSLLNGYSGPSSEIANECANSPVASITLRVPPGGTFQINLNTYTSCSPAGTWVITSWLETQQ